MRGIQMTETVSLRERWEERYNTGPTPWDTGITPPEVVEFWTEGRLTPTGLALDIGCGAATNVTYLAGLGLTVVGVDISLLALQRGEQRLARQPHQIQRRAHLVLANVSVLPLANAQATYALDIGCFHTLPAGARHDYTKEIARNLSSGGYYHLYAFDRAPEDADNPDARGVAPNEISERFSPFFEVVRIDRATPNPHPCRWYLLQKRCSP
jgi:SAM-dependent methyltransferase